MRRKHPRSSFGAALLPLLLALLALLAACSSGDAEDAENIVEQTTTTEAEDTSTTLPDAGTGTTAEGAEEIAVTDLEVGDCFDDPAFASAETSTVRRTTLVQCFDPHDAEVFAAVRYTQGEDADFPGEEAVQDYAGDQCLDRFEDFVGTPYVESRLDVGTVWPTEESWEQGDRGALCVVFHVEHQKLEGTMDGAEI
jgi:hypothetical protein